MGTPYAGDPTNFPTDYMIPDDSDPPTAAAVNVGFEALGDRTAFLQAKTDARGGITAAIIYTAAGPTTWTAGPHDTRVELEGCGGGGGGGGGGQGGTSTTHYACGGGGGGAAPRRRVVLEVTPGTIYEVLVADGGAGGLGGTGTGADGDAGGDTIFRVQGGATLATWKGGRGGRGGDLATGTTDYLYAAGGSPTDQHRPFATAVSASRDESFCYGPGFGGEGVAAQPVQTARKGANSIEGFFGGSGGAFGVAGGSYSGGGAGGGGAAGPYGGGTNGLNGGDGNAAGAGTAAEVGGGFTAVNRGSGGGGGGGGGTGTSGGVGGDGIGGSSGRLSLRVIG